MLELLFCPQHGLLRPDMLAAILPLLQAYLGHPLRFLSDMLSNIRYKSIRNHGAF